MQFVSSAKVLSLWKRMGKVTLGSFLILGSSLKNEEICRIIAIVLTQSYFYVCDFFFFFKDKINLVSRRKLVYFILLFYTLKKKIIRNRRERRQSGQLLRFLYIQQKCFFIKNYIHFLCRRNDTNPYNLQKQCSYHLIIDISTFYVVLLKKNLDS